MGGQTIGERDDEVPGPGLASVTHARLRAAQGDTNGARAVLRAVLLGNPRDGEARRMLESIEGLRATRHDEPVEPAVRAAQPADAAALAGAFRAAIEGTPSARIAARLRSWMQKVERRRGARRDAP